MILNAKIDVEKAMGTGGPRAGHKYVSRTWGNERWVYEYQKAPSAAHGVLAVPDVASNPQREHSMDVSETSQMGELGAVADYNEALAQELSTPGIHAVPHPTEEGVQLGVEVKVSKSGKMKLRAKSPDGTKIKDFTSRGAFVRWHMGTSQTTVMHDGEGQAWFKLIPNVGQVEGGTLRPPKDPNRQWIVRLHEDHPDFAAAKEGGQRVEWYKKSEDAGKQHHQTELRNRQMVSGDVLPEQAPETAPDTPPQDDHPSAEESPTTEVQEEAAAAQAGQEVPVEPTVPGSAIDRLQRGQLPYRLDTAPGSRRSRRVLDIPVAQKEQMVEEIARQFWPAILSNANAVVRSNPFFRDDPQKWVSRFIGGQSFRPPEANEMGQDGKPIFVGLESGSLAHRAISDAIESYDPTKGYFASYLAGQNGKLFWNMQRRNKVDDFIAEVKASAPMEMRGGKEGESFSREEKISGAESQQRMQDLMSGDEEPAADEGPETLDPWIQQQDEALGQAEAHMQHISPEMHNQLRHLFNQIRSVPGAERGSFAQRFTDALQQMGLGDYAVDVEKSLEQVALEAILYDDVVQKGVAALSKDKNVDPAHTYSHREGDEDNPIFWFRDPVGNLVRYTNAPAGHDDTSNLDGDAARHLSEPDMGQTPEYFTPDGRKLDRCPPQGCFPEWNQSYNRYDPQNLWIARWPSPQTGDYRHAYIDADIRAVPKLQTNRMNALHDARLPMFRQRVHDLFHSRVLKDQLTALALALLDQGAFRAHELAALTPAQVYVEGSLVQLGSRKVYCGPQLHQVFEVLKRYKSPNEPLFSAPVMNKDGTPEVGLIRRMGPNYWARVLGQLGMSLLSFQTYRASKTFSREIQRLLTTYNMSWDQAVQQALLVVALEWGHDLTMEPDAPRVMQLVLETLIDPVLVETLQRKSQEMGLGLGQGTTEAPPAAILIPTVSMEQQGFTGEEQEFSRWLHSVPLHLHAEVGNG